MQRLPSPRVFRVVTLIVVVAWAPQAGRAQALEPIVYTVRVPSPDTQYAEVEATVPTERRESIEMMMAIWSPGFYRVQDYASRVHDLSARTRDGKTLEVDRPQHNRWRIQTGGAPAAVVSYRLYCNQRSVTTNWVSDDLGVLNGAATFITLVEQARRPHEVRLELPAPWKQAMTALDAAPDGVPNHYRAPDFDTLVDSPILAGDLDVREFEVDGSKHYVVAGGDRRDWDGRRAAEDLEQIVRGNRRLWGFLPFQKYFFLIVFREGGGGLEHHNSTLVTASPTRAGTPAGYRALLGLISHEYFHAFNVKRLRPIELGPFDYEQAPRTPSLWIAEGVTSYYGGLALRRSGLRSPEEHLSSLSSQIEALQNSPGRLVQTLEQSSYDVWTNSVSGVNPSETTVSYYVKGQVVGLLLDAKIRRATGGSKSLDDVMRLAYKRYAGERGFTPEQFRMTAEEVAGVELKDWCAKAIASTEELNYTDALDWFGLRFGTNWRLEIREDATASQRGRLRAWLEPTGGGR